MGFFIDEKPCAHGIKAVAEDVPIYGQKIAPDVSGRMAAGHGLRLASALLQGVHRSDAERDIARTRLRSTVSRATGRPDTPDSKIALSQRLKQLNRIADRGLAEQLELLVRFEDQGLYLQDGCRNMIVWMDQHLRLGRIAASERLRVGRALLELPVLSALFALGEVSYSQLREVTRHATADTDGEFAAAILELSVSETIDYCRRFRHFGDLDSDARTAAEQGLDAVESAAALRAFQRRSLSVQSVDEHSTRIVMELPVDLAAEFLLSLEHVEDCIRDGGDSVGDQSSEEGPVLDHSNRDSPKQVRADAAVLMSRRSLALAGEAVAMADRYRVNVSVDARLLGRMSLPEAEADTERPQLHGPGCQQPASLCTATATRLAEQAGFTLLATDENRQIVGTLKKAPLFTRKQLQALRARDRCCQMPGCRSTRHLHGHHIVHRENGGHSGLDNAVLVCGSCHRLLHEGGFQLEAIGPNGAVPLRATVEHLDRLNVDSRSRQRARAKASLIRAFRVCRPSSIERIDGATLFPRVNTGERRGAPPP